MLRALLPPATQLLSLDASTQRLEKLRQVATDSNWSVATADFTQFQGESADAILIDAPCSSLGSVRRKPDTKYRSSRDQLAQHASSQQALIESALHNLKPGGVVGYVTCTPTVAETDRVIRGAIKRGWQTIDAVDAIGAVSPKLVASRRPNAAAMIWGHRNGSDTMFLSLLRKPEA
jgi:16S rRNA (cytosine967-C5)-methyltransferase